MSVVAIVQAGQAAPAPQPAAAPQAPATPAAPSAPVVFTSPGVRIEASAGNPAQVYQGAVHQRRELRRIREGLEQERRELSRQLQSPAVEGANKAGLEARLQIIDRRIIDVEQQIAQSDALVASTAAMPGAIQPEPPDPVWDEDLIGPLGAMFIGLVLMPLAIAQARRLWKRAGQAVSAVPQALVDRFVRLEQNVDTMAVEIERISEGQRFMTKLFAEQGPRAVGQGAAEPVPVAVREPAREERVVR